MVDIQREGVVKRRRIRQTILGIIGAAFLGFITYVIAGLEPAAPSVDFGTLWTGPVDRGEMVREVRGPGTLVPENIWWVPARTSGRVERIQSKAGVTVTADTIILELSNPQLELDALEAEKQLVLAGANMKDLKVRLESQFLSQRAGAATVRANFEEARLRAERDQALAKENLISSLDATLSKVRADELAIRNQLEQERLEIARESIDAQVAAQEAEIDRRQALYDLRLKEVAALSVRAGVAGVLQEVPVEVGQQIPAGGNLARVAQPESLIAELRIPETQAKDVTIGQKVNVDARNGIIRGIVERIDPSVREGTVTVDVKLIDSLPSWARPDLSVDGTVEIERLVDVLYMGRPAHGQANSLISIFKLVKDGQEAIRTQVQLGRSSVSTVEIVKGLEHGESVVLSDMSRWDGVDRIRLSY